MTPTAERILKAMDHLHLSGFALIKQFGLSRGTVTNWRNGTNGPRMAFMRLFCDQYGVSLSWLLTGDGDMMEASLPDNDREFLRKVEMVKKETGLTNRDIAKLIGSYSTIISELRAGKTTVRPEWRDTLEKEYGFIWNVLDAKKEIIRLREDIEKIKKALLLINISV